MLIFAVYLYHSTMALNDGIADRQAEPGPFADFLGGKKWFKNLVLDLWRNSRTGIFYHELDKTRSMRMGDGQADFPPCGVA